MMSYLFSGLGSYVAPRPDILHEFQVIDFNFSSLLLILLAAYEIK